LKSADNNVQSVELSPQGIELIAKGHLLEFFYVSLPSRCGHSQNTRVSGIPGAITSTNTYVAKARKIYSYISHTPSSYPVIAYWFYGIPGQQSTAEL
jgi:hypothetical protein